MVLGQGVFSWPVLFIVTAVIVAIWILLEIQKFRHKVLTVFIIGFLIMMYVGFAVVSETNNLDLKTVPGVIEASKVYFAWFISVFKNIITVTSNAIHLDWTAKSAVWAIFKN